MKSLLNITLLIITEAVAVVLPYIIMAGFLLMMEDDEMNFKQALAEVWDCPPIAFCMFVWGVIVAFVATKDIWKIDC